MNLRDNDGHFQSREDLYVVSGSKRYRIDSLHEVDGVVGLESRVEVRKGSVQVEPNRERLAGRFLFSSLFLSENALLRPDLKVDGNTGLVNHAS